MFCPNCGASLPDDAVFCTGCGIRLADYVSSPPQPVTPIPTEPEEPAPAAVEEPAASSAPEAAVIAPKPSRKKMWIILICIAAVLLLVGGGTGLYFWMSSSTPTAESINPNQYNPDNFTLLLEAGDYQKAADMYLQTAYGNTEREFELKGRMSDFLQEAVDGYWDGSMEYDAAENRFTTVSLIVDNSQGMVSWAQFVGQRQEFEDADVSKVAYDSGRNLMDNGNYAAAIAEFSKVAAEDCNYQDAQEQLNSARTQYQDQMVSTAQGYIDSGDYISASATIEEGLAVLPESSELLTLQTTCQAGYISSVLAEADTVFVTPATDWEAAIDVLLPAMQQYPDDSQLQQRYNYYMEYQPVSIFDLEPYTTNGRFQRVENFSDNMGNVYSQAFTTHIIYSQKSQTYDISGKYNTLTFTIASGATYSSDSKGTVRIIGDGRVLWERNDLTLDMKPENISVNVTGVTDLTIEIDDEYFVILANLTLQKTVK